MEIVREIARDKVTSITEKGELVGIYFSDTDGGVAIKELPVEEADEYVAHYNTAAALLRVILRSSYELGMRRLELDREIHYSFLRNRKDTY